MALAVIKYKGIDGNQLIFDADAGQVNRYYSFVIGSSEKWRTQGFSIMAQPVYTAPLTLIPMPQMGRFQFRVSKAQFSRDNNAIQLFTFKDKSKAGKAVSRILRIPVSLPLKKGMSYSKSLNMNDQANTRNKALDNAIIDKVPFSYQESKYSEGMFLGALAGLASAALPAISSALPAIGGMVAKALPAIGGIATKMLPAVKGIAGKLLGNLGGGGAAGMLKGVLGKVVNVAGGPQGLANISGDLLTEIAGAVQNAKAQGGDSNPATEEVINLLTQLMAAKAGGANALSNGQALSIAQSSYIYSEGMRKRKKRNKRNNSVNRKKKGVSPSANQRKRYSNAGNNSTISPEQKSDLISSLVNLGASGITKGVDMIANKLKQTPKGSADPAAFTEMVQKIIHDGAADGANSKELLGTLINFLQNKLGASESASPAPATTMAVQQSLRAFSQQVEEPYAGAMTMELYNGPTVSLSEQLAKLPEGYLDFLPIDKVKLDMDSAAKVELAGRDRIVYSLANPIRIPLNIQTPKTIRRAKLSVCLKKADSQKIVAKTNLNLNMIEHGPLPDLPSFSAAELVNVQPGCPYLMSVRLIWKNRQGRHIGTSLTQTVFFTKNLAFDRVEESGAIIPLNDVKKYRVFWHKIWGESIERKNREITIDCKYYYALDLGRSNNAQMETITKFEETSLRKMTGKMKSGLQMSLETLNQLAKTLPDGKKLSEKEIEAINNAMFANNISTLGRFRADFDSEVGDSISLWVYPEVQLKTIVFKQATAINRNGIVTSWNDKKVPFPIPIAIHYIGTKL